MNKKALLRTVAAITLILCSNIGCLEASWTGPTWRSPIQISPATFTTIRTHNISLTVETSVLDPIYSTLNEINEVYYEADWLPNQGYIFNHLNELQASGGMGNDVSDEWLQPYGLERAGLCEKNIEGEGWVTQMVGRVLNLTGIPDGTHKLTVYAKIKLEQTGYSTVSSSASFRVETEPQIVNSAGPSNLETRSLDCLKAVLPIDFSQYIISLNGTYPVEYTFSSNGSVFLTVFQYQNQVIDTIDLRVLSGSIMPSRSYANLTDAAADFLLRYSTFTGGNMSALIRILSLVNETGIAAGTNVILGSLRLDVGEFFIPNTADVTSFHWTYLPDGADVILSFDYGVFYSFQDRQHFSVQQNADAMNAAFPTPEPTSEPNPSPSPTITPTTEPSATPKHSTGFLGTSLSIEYGYAIVAVLAAVVIGASVLVYLKKLPRLFFSL